jgi:hypothetical protein
MTSSPTFVRSRLVPLVAVGAASPTPRGPPVRPVIAVGGLAVPRVAGVMGPAPRLPPPGTVGLAPCGTRLVEARAVDLVLWFTERMPRATVE